MKANELRIGNWIKYEDKLVQVVQVSSMMILCQRDENQFLVNCAPKVFQPIELTGDILIKAGYFKKGYHEIYFMTPCVYCYDYYISCQNIKDNKYSFVASGYKNGELKRQIRLDNIQYLHELQNIFFSFTNQELEIKL